MHLGMCVERLRRGLLGSECFWMITWVEEDTYTLICDFICLNNVIIEKNSKTIYKFFNLLLHIFFFRTVTFWRNVADKVTFAISFRGLCILAWYCHKVPIVPPWFFFFGKVHQVQFRAKRQFWKEKCVRAEAYPVYTSSNILEHTV